MFVQSSTFRVHDGGIILQGHIVLLGGKNLAKTIFVIS